MEGGARGERKSRTALKLLFNRLSHCRHSRRAEREAESNLSPDCQLSTELNRQSRERSRRYCSATARNGEKTELYLRKDLMLVCPVHSTYRIVQVISRFSALRMFDSKGMKRLAYKYIYTLHPLK